MIRFSRILFRPRNIYFTASSAHSRGWKNPQAFVTWHFTRARTVHNRKSMTGRNDDDDLKADLDVAGNSSFKGNSSDYGDFVDSDGEGDVEDVSEPIERYDAGLYYPVGIGEVLNGRYRVEHKLGWGGFSTVWMAHDVQDAKDVALKIMVPGQKAEYEFQMQNEILRSVGDVSNLVTIQGTFVLPGKDGDGSQHRVLVLPLLAPSLGLRAKLLDVALRVSAAKQLLVALKGLHDVGLVHRDLNEGALMWEISSSLAGYDTASKYQHLGRPQKVPLGNHLWKQGELVKQVTIPLDLLGNKVYLGDFGLTIKSGTSVNIKHQAPYSYCAPERFHNVDPSFASDIWSYMCLFSNLYLGFEVFYGNGGRSTVFSWVEQLGAMPEQWKGRFWLPAEVEDSWYDSSTSADLERNLAARIARLRPDTDPAERELVLSIMRKAFCYLPEDRIMANQLLQDPDFKALMEIYNC